MTSARGYDFDKISRIIRKLADRGPVEEPVPIRLPIRVIIKKGSEAGSIYSFSDYNAYLAWRIGKANSLRRIHLLRRDTQTRKQEIWLEFKFNKPMNYYRGVFEVDFEQIFPSQPRLKEQLKGHSLTRQYSKSRSTKIDVINIMPIII